MTRSSFLSTRRWRASFALAAAAALTLGVTGPALADSIAVDGDNIKSPPHVQYDDVENSANHACGTRGTPVEGKITVAFNSSGGGTHFTAGEALNIQITDSQTGITVPNPVVSIPATWTTGSTLLIPIFTTVTTAVPQGTHPVNISVTGATSGLNKTDTYNVVVTTDCAVVNPNTAPTIAFTTAPTTAPEGSNVTYVFAITDPDAGNTWTYAATYPTCGSTGSIFGTPSIDNATKTGTFTCHFPDGLVPAVAATVKAKVVDSAGAASNEATADTTVTNVDPDVLKPSFDPATVDCNNTAYLDGVSFNDPGVLDGDWTINVDWGDGSTDTVITTSTQGPYSPDPSHVYTTPGSYSATVTVTDKDGGVGSNTSDPITVNQSYSVDFLPPFDDSSPASGLIVNKMKNGRVVPVKATIFDDCTGAFVTDPTEVVTIHTSKTAGTGTGDPVEEYADAGASASNTNRFRWSSDGFWIYNLDSKSLGLIVNNNYRVDIKVDGVVATDDEWAVLQPVK